MASLSNAISLQFTDILPCSSNGFQWIMTSVTGKCLPLKYSWLNVIQMGGQLYTTAWAVLRNAERRHWFSPPDEILPHVSSIFALFALQPIETSQDIYVSQKQIALLFALLHHHAPYPHRKWTAVLFHWEASAVSYCIDSVIHNLKIFGIIYLLLDLSLQYHPSPKFLIAIHTVQM